VYSKRLDKRQNDTKSAKYPSHKRHIKQQYFDRTYDTAAAYVSIVKTVHTHSRAEQSKNEKLGCG